MHTLQPLTETLKKYTLASFPMIGKSAQKVSNDWKNPAKNFQWLEKCAEKGFFREFYEEYGIHDVHKGLKPVRFVDGIIRRALSKVVGTRKPVGRRICGAIN